MMTHSAGWVMAWYRGYNDDSAGWVMAWYRGYTDDTQCWLGDGMV